MERLKVIKKVEKPTPWVNSMTIVHKPDGSLRICLDPTDLNKAVMREHVVIPTPEELHTKLTGAKIFSKLDLMIDGDKKVVSKQPFASFPKVNSLQS